MGASKRSEMARRAEYLRRNMTPCERKLWFCFLKDHEIGFRPQKVIGDYIVDFYSRKIRLSIEIDGESHFNEKSMEYDRIRTLRLEMREIFEIRFTNDEVKENFEGVCERIQEVIQARRHDVRSLDFSRLKEKG